MANQQGKKNRSTSKSRPAGPSRSHAAPPGQQGRARENGTHRNPDAGPETNTRRPRSGGGGRNRSGRERQAEARPSPAEPLGVVERTKANLGIAGLRAAKGVRAAGTKAADGLRSARTMAAESVAEHPTAVNAIGASLAAAGIGLLAARMLSQRGEQRARGRRGDTGLFRRAGETLGAFKERVADAMDSLRDGTSRLGEYGRDGLTKVGGGLRDGASAVGSGLREGASAVGSGAERGYEYTKDKFGTLWDEYPLATGAGLLALGVAIGMMIPTSRLEQSLYGQKAGEVNRRAKSAGRELLKQGRQVADNVMSGTGEVVRDMADLDALSPDKLTRKVKRLANRLKDVVAEALPD